MVERALDLPLEFEEDIYYAFNEDLHAFTRSDLRLHYEAHGREEGRIASHVCDRRSFLATVTGEKSDQVLEIGPFCNPVITGDNVRYFDVLDDDQMRRRADALGLQADCCPHIDYVSHTGDLSDIDDVFNLIVSSHVIEHQPDLILHLQNVENLIELGGRYAFIIPDHRYCFDHFLGISSPSDIIAAHIKQQKFHTLSSFLDHRIMLTHNDPMRHWRGDHGSYLKEDLRSKLDAVLQEWHLRQGSYVDVHAWQFTPKTFRDILNYLYETGHTRLRVERVYPTVRDSMEFYVVLNRMRGL